MNRAFLVISLFAFCPSKVENPDVLIQPIKVLPEKPIFPCYHHEIEKYSNKYQICPGLLASVILVESNCKIDAVGKAGELGLGQIRKEIWGDFLQQNQIKDIRGVEATAAVLSYHVKKWGMKKGVERYNGQGKKAKEYRAKVMKKRQELLGL